jgi:hypothetical protein
VAETLVVYFRGEFKLGHLTQGLGGLADNGNLPNTRPMRPLPYLTMGRGGIEEHGYNGGRGAVRRVRHDVPEHAPREVAGDFRVRPTRPRGEQPADQAGSCRGIPMHGREGQPLGAMSCVVIAAVPVWIMAAGVSSASAPGLGLFSPTRLSGQLGDAQQ